MHVSGHSYSQQPASCATSCRGNEIHSGLQRGNGLFYTSLAGGNRTTSLHPIRVTVPARQGDLLYQHDGEEWLYVLSGQLVLILADEEHVLQPGDAAHFDARTPHRLSAKGGGDAEIILVACAAPAHFWVVTCEAICVPQLTQNC